MAFPKNLTLALVALLLMATTSPAKSQEPEDRQILPILPPILPPRTVTILGVVTCGLPVVPTPSSRRVNVTLSCDGGRTALVPPVTATVGGLFSIIVDAALFDPTRCFVFVRTPVAGCPRLAAGQILRAPIIAISEVLPPTLSFLRLFITTLFGVVRIG